MSIIPNANPLEDSPFTTQSMSTLPQSAATLMSSSSISQFDWHETTDSHVLKAEVPGLKKEEMKIEVDSERTLQVSGERNVEKKDESGVERSSCMFKKCFTLPPNAKLDLVKASYENGVLTITIPKMNEATAKAIENSYWLEERITLLLFF